MHHGHIYQLSAAFVGQLWADGDLSVRAKRPLCNATATTFKGTGKVELGTIATH